MRRALHAHTLTGYLSQYTPGSIRRQSLAIPSAPCVSFRFRLPLAAQHKQATTYQFPDPLVSLYTSRRTSLTPKATLFDLPLSRLSRPLTPAHTTTRDIGDGKKVSESATCINSVKTTSTSSYSLLKFYKTRCAKFNNSLRFVAPERMNVHILNIFTVGR